MRKNEIKNRLAKIRLEIKDKEIEQKELLEELTKIEDREEYKKYLEKNRVEEFGDDGIVDSFRILNKDINITELIREIETFYEIRIEKIEVYYSIENIIVRVSDYIED